jgi:L-threonylcarbamoyladenylate synthase
LKLLDLHSAKERLLLGDVVAIPTETVYGLAGWIYSEEGLKKIFSTKERPFFDPLIVHVDGIESAKKLTSLWTEAHEALAQAFWPGPLTLIAQKNSLIHPLITSGLDSVALRCPNHPVALELLKSIDGGLAAPSANKFGKTSPSSSQHVFDEFADAVGILEGGPCEIGIESTVLGITQTDSGFQLEIYRPGGITSKMIQEVIQATGLKAEVTYTQSPVAPGQLKHHYMPKIPLVIVPQSFDWKRDRQLIEDQLGATFSFPIRWTQPADAHLASRELYESLRSFDQKGFDLILTSQTAEHSSEEWLGIWNRLEKAKTLRL